MYMCLCVCVCVCLCVCVHWLGVTELCDNFPALCVCVFAESSGDAVAEGGGASGTL